MGESIIGRRYGMLVVQAETDPVRDALGHLIRMFKCRCDCGTEKVFRYNDLMAGRINSCGCTRFPKKPRADLTGSRFGHLTVLFEAPPRIQKCGDKKRSWVCACDCGKETTVLQSNLCSPHGTRSCGCANKYVKRPGKAAMNLTGNRYGRLVVLSPAVSILRPNGSHRYHWLCRCDCGNETVVQEEHLLYGHTRSCGCLKKNKLNNNTFGMLTVISKAKTGKHAWTCRCMCGNEIVVDQDDLFWGSVTSCGCQEKGTNNSVIVGRRYGKLTVLRETWPLTAPNGETIRRCLCRCDCGREVVVRQRNLKNKITRSCGCLKSGRKNRFSGLLAEKQKPKG